MEPQERCELRNAVKTRPGTTHTSWAPTLGSQRAQARSNGWTTSVVAVWPAVRAKAWARCRRWCRWPTARSTIRPSRVQVDATGATRPMRRQPAKLPASTRAKDRCRKARIAARSGPVRRPLDRTVDGALGRRNGTRSLAKGKKGKASREVSGSGRGQTSEGEEIPRVPPGWNKPGRWCRRGAKRAKEPWTCRPYRTRAAGNGVAGEVGASAPVPAGRAGWEPHGEAASPQEHRREAKPQEGMLRASVAPRAGERRGGAQDESGAQVTRTIGRDGRRSRAEDPRSQAVAAKAEGGGSTR